MSNKKIWIDKFEPLEIASFPFRVNNLVILAFFSLVFTYELAIVRIVGPAGFVFTIILLYLATLFFMGYGFIIAEYTTRGYQYIGNMSASILFSEKPRLFKLLVLITSLLSIVSLPSEALSLLILGLLSIIIFPLSLSVLIMEHSLTAALNPLRWWRMLRGIEADSTLVKFALIQLASVALGFAVLSFHWGLFDIVLVFGFLASLMMLFRALGVLLHHNAESLGIEVRFSDEVEQAQRQQMADRELSEFASTLYRLVNVGKNRKAWHELNQKLIADKYQTEPALFEQIRHWENPGLAVMMGQGYVERLVDANDLTRAWEVLAFCVAENKTAFSLSRADILTKLHDSAHTIAQKRIICSVLRQAQRDLPGHPRAPAMLLQAAEIAAFNLDDFSTAESILTLLIECYPALSTDADYRRLWHVVQNETSP